MFFGELFIYVRIKSSAKMIFDRKILQIKFYNSCLGSSQIRSSATPAWTREATCRYVVIAIAPLTNFYCVCAFRSRRDGGEVIRHGGRGQVMIHSYAEVRREVIMSYVRDPIIWARAHYALSVKYGRLYYYHR